jgi:hypothetical protein
MQTLTTVDLHLSRRLLASTLALSVPNQPNNHLSHLNNHHVEHQSEVHLAPQMAQHNGKEARRSNVAVCLSGKVLQNITL